MKNLFYYLGLFYNLLTKKENDEMILIIDDSPSNLINKDVIRNICRLGLFFNMDITIYQGKLVFVLCDRKEVQDYLDNFKYSGKPFNMDRITDLLSSNSYKIIYSDFHLNEKDDQSISKLQNISFIANDFSYNEKAKQKIYKLSA